MKLFIGALLICLVAVAGEATPRGHRTAGIRSTATVYHAPKARGTFSYRAPRHKR